MKAPPAHPPRCARLVDGAGGGPGSPPGTNLQGAGGPFQKALPRAGRPGRFRRLRAAPSPPALRSRPAGGAGAALFPCAHLCLREAAAGLLLPRPAEVVTPRQAPLGARRWEGSDWAPGGAAGAAVQGHSSSGSPSAWIGRGCPRLGWGAWRGWGSRVCTWAAPRCSQAPPQPGCGC